MLKFIIGSIFLGLGVYLFKNKAVTKKLESKLQDGLNVINENTKDIQEKVMDVFTDTKSTLSKSLS